MKILTIEDDRETAEYIVRGLTDEGHRVTHVSNGSDALLRTKREEFDILIVDRMLPGIDGLQFVKKLRRSGNETPVLFVTTLGGVDDRVTGLNAGGDDYLVKPFAFAELLARVGALGRRAPTIPLNTNYSIADLEVNLLSRTVRRGGREIELQPREFRLLEYLLRNAGKIVTRTMLLENVWDFHFDPHTNVVETHISRLRSKVDKDFTVNLIHTVRGTGYCIRAPS